MRERFEEASAGSRDVALKAALGTAVLRKDDPDSACWSAYRLLRVLVRIRHRLLEFL
jgi:hypothetical protein